MNDYPVVVEWTNLVFRWMHVVASVLWIGHLYFFNWVNAQLAKTYDADTKKKVVPELMPRALYWFRWGAAYTWITGITLLILLTYLGGAAVAPDSTLGQGAVTGIGLAQLVVAWFVYDVLAKTVKNEKIAATVLFLLALGTAYGLSLFLTPRAVFIQMGSMLGTLMATNVWFRIWPSQRKIIAAIRDGGAPDAALVALAGLRSKHNTYMSVPLILFMVSNHFPTALSFPTIDGTAMGWLGSSAFILVGWAATKLLYMKSAGAAPKTF